MTWEDVKQLRDLGSDIFTVALDAATPEIFDRTRGKGVSRPTVGRATGIFWRQPATYSVIKNSVPI